MISAKLEVVLAKAVDLFIIYLFIFNSRHKAHDTKIINTVQHR